MLNLFESFLVLGIIFTVIFSVSFVLTEYQYNENSTFHFKQRLMRNMIGLVLTIFGILKLYDLNKFVTIFSKYDIISKYITSYPYIYPFIEIVVGLVILNGSSINNIDLFTVLFIMIVSIISVVTAIAFGGNLRCGCLGAFFHIPLSYTTLSENTMMIFMAIYLIVMQKSKSNVS